MLPITRPALPFRGNSVVAIAGKFADMSPGPFRITVSNHPMEVTRQRRDFSKAITIALFLAPGFLLLLLFLLMPVGQSAYFSFYRWNGLGPLESFVGFQNYQQVLSDKIFQGAVSHSLFIVALSLLLQLPLAMALAITLVRGNLRGKRIFRTIFFVPYVFSEVITAFIWMYVYHPRGGLINTVLAAVIPGFETQAWLAERDTVMWAIFFVLTWKFFGFHMLLYMAGLQNVPRDVEDAARIDGANESQLLRFVTLPLMGPTIRLTVFLSVLGSLQQFILVWILTEGGPVSSSELIVTYMFKYGIQRLNLGFGSAIAVILFLMTLLFSLGYQRTVMVQDYE